MIPSFLGKHLYPGGYPIEKENLYHKNESYYDIFVRVYDQKKKCEQPSQEDEDILIEWVVYFINAPIYDGEFIIPYRNLDFSILGFDDAMDVLIKAVTGAYAHRINSFLKRRHEK